MNKIYLIGNLCHAPELRVTKSGKDVCNFNIAVNRRSRGQDGKQQTDFFNVQVWGAQAVNCANYLAKGRKVAIVGEMHSRQYDAKDGTKKTAWEVITEEVEFLTPKGEGQTGVNPDQQQGRAMPQSNTNGFDPANQYTQVEDEDLPF